MYKVEFLKLKGKDKRIAVAFWGSGALSKLGLDGQGAKGAKVICNLESGATNPSVVEELIRAGADVKSNSRLHAKVYAVGSSVILGSSNASGNGLVVEGKELNGWIEANILTDDKSLVTTVNNWFDDLWECKDSRVVDEAMLTEARDKWCKRRQLAPVVRSGKWLLDTCQENKELFNNVYLAIYTYRLSKLANETVKQINNGSREIAGLNTTDFGRVWGYGEGWSFPEGAWLIDIDASGQTPKIWGVARIYSPSLTVKVKGEGDLTLACRKPGIQVAGITKTIRMSRENKEFLTKGVPFLLGKSEYNLIPLIDAIAMLDNQKHKNQELRF